MKWTPINVQKPEYNRDVLMWDSKTGYFIGSRYQEFRVGCGGDGYKTGAVIVEEPSHWKALPRPPKI